MPSIRILLLGPPEIRSNGRALSIQRRVTRSLLFFLASRGAMIGREELLDIFWYQEPEADARRRLREALSRLRNALPQPELIVSHSGLVGLNFELVSVDQLEFQELIGQAGRIPWQIPPLRPLPQPIYQLLKKAVGLWRSTRFLAGADFPGTPGLDDWHLQVGQHMEHLLERVLERLSDHAYIVGDLEESLQFAGMALQNDELNDELHYRVLRSLIDMGRRSEARQYYDHIQKLLRRELDTSPSPKLANLHAQIRDEEGRQPPLQAHSRWNIRPSLMTPFVGRQDILSRLRNAFHRGGGAVIFGESGQGKTRLLQEFSHHSENQLRLLLAACRPAESNLPFQPIIELLRYHIQPDEWLALSTTWASQLSLLLPDLNDIRPDLERPLFEHASDAAFGQARALLMESVRQVLLLIAKERPLLLCLDDAHWADEGTLATVAYLLERPPFDERALLVIAARQEENNAHLDNLIASLIQSTRFNIFHLSQLEQDEVAQLACHVLRQMPPEPFVARLARETGGNPLFILEILRAFLEREHKSLDEIPNRFLVTDSVRNLILARLQRLSPRARRALEIAAVIGEEYDPDDVREVGQQSELDFIAAMEELQDQLLIKTLVRSQGDIRYSFIHSKIREVLLQEINPVKARLLHGKVARVLRSKLQYQVDNRAAVLAQHFELAGQPEIAFDYWVLAGKYARQLFATTEAIEAFELAEKLLSHHYKLSDEQINNLYSTWAEMSYELDDPETIRRLGTAQLAIGHQRESPLLIGAALDCLGDACLALNQFWQGLDYTNRAIAQLERSGVNSDLVEAYTHRGVFLTMLNRVEEAIEAFQKGLSLDDESLDRQAMIARANAHYNIATAQNLGGWPQNGLNEAQQALAYFSEFNRAYGKVAACSAMALSRFLLGEYLQGLEDAREGIELGERIQAWRMLGYLHDYAAMIELALGNLDETWKHAGQAIELGERYHHNEIASTGYRILGDCFFRLNSLPQSLNYYQKAIDASHNEFLSVDPRFRLGLTYALAGEKEKGEEILQDAIITAHSAGLGAITVLAQTGQAKLYVCHQEWDRAKQTAKQVKREAEKRRMASSRIIATWLLGEVALYEQDLAKAGYYLNQAVSEAAEISSIWVELAGRITLCQTLRESGEPYRDQSQKALLLIDRLQANATLDEVRDCFLNFRKQLESGLEV